MFFKETLRNLSKFSREVTVFYKNFNIFLKTKVLFKVTLSKIAKF